MLTEGQILEGKYKIGRLLGKGGMGAVFFGENTLIKRAVAIKVLHDVDPNSENARRFEKEAQAAGQIGSDHIVEVLDLGNTPEGDRFMVMEFLDGESLKGRLARGRLKPADLIPLITQVLDGLTAAHAAGIVHRDLKPDNIYILKEKAGRRDFVKIVDFGISKFNALGAEGGMTKTGAVMGTPFYMSPEQARAANEVDNRSDLYAIGVLMYQAVTGAVPFNGNTFTELLFKIVFEDVAHPNTIVPDLDSGFAQIVLKTMARDASDRYQTAGELKEALTSWRETPLSAVAPHLGPPPAAPSNAFKKANLGGTAMIDAAPSAPPPQPSFAATSVLGATGPFVQSQPFAQSAAQPPQSAQQAWQQPQQQPQQPQPFAQSVGPGSQILDAPRAPPKSRAGVFAVVAVLLVVGGAAAAFFATRSGKGTTRDAATTTAIEAPSASAVVTAVATASATSAASVAAPATSEPATSATAASSQRRVGAWPPPTSKPTAAPAKQNGTLKDLGY